MENELPKGWAKIELKYLGEYINGRAFKPSEWKQKGLPIIRIQNLNNPTASYNFSDQTHEEKYRVVKEDLLMAWSASLGVYIWNGNDAWLNQHIFRVIPNKKLVTKRFLFYALQEAIDEFYTKTHGSGMVHITKPVFEAHRIPLPPLDEQNRIVAKLDAVLARVNNCKARFEKIPAVLKNFRQSVLAAAVSGELTKEWREKNSQIKVAKDLISDMISIRKDRYLKANSYANKQNKRNPPEYDNLQVLLRADLELFEIPKTWQWVDFRFLMDEAEPFCYGVVQPGEDVIDGPRLIRILDIENGKILKSQLRGISNHINRNYSRSIVKEGDLLVSVVGTIGRCAIVPKELEGCNIARAIAKVPIRDFDNRYLYHWLNTSLANNWLVGDSREVARKTLNLEQLRTLPVPLPPKEEQREIVHKVEELFHYANSIEARYKKAKAWFDKIPQSILAKAFRGELVPQDENDEPASVLLERIKSLKMTSPLTPLQKQRGKRAARGKKKVVNTTKHTTKTKTSKARKVMSRM